MPHIADIKAHGEQYDLPTDLLSRDLVGAVMELATSPDLDFDEAWPDGEVIIDNLVQHGTWMFIKREKLAFSGSEASQHQRTKEPPLRSTVYAFHDINEARFTAALSIARQRRNEREARARRDNPNWPLISGNLC